jgi:hypothetical protein
MVLYGNSGIRPTVLQSEFQIINFYWTLHNHHIVYFCQTVILCLELYSLQSGKQSFRTATWSTKYNFNFSFLSEKYLLKRLYMYLFMKIIFETNIDMIFTFVNSTIQKLFIIYIINVWPKPCLKRLLLPNGGVNSWVGSLILFIYGINGALLSRRKKIRTR